MQLRMILRILLVIGTVSSTCMTKGVWSQERPKIGLVLSGGGARGAAHIGVLKALEASGVQVDCIVGTSIGALIGGYYAAGWTPQEMEEVLLSGVFEDRILGQTSNRFRFKESPSAAVLFDLRWSGGPRMVKSSLVPSLDLDYALMEELAPATRACKQNFDHLHIPFRCVASNVLTKTDTVFSSGDLASSIRASMAFPFYLPPVWMNGQPLYDGGLYNNVPIDVMVREFRPDFILVSSVLSDAVDVRSDDLMSQLEALIVRVQPTNLLSDSMVIIEPELTLSTFDFSEFSNAIKSGEEACFKSLENSGLSGFVSQGDSDFSDRITYRSSLPEFRVGSCEVSGLSPQQERYASRILTNQSPKQELATFRKNLILLDSDQHIGRIQPRAFWDSTSQRFDIQLAVEEERERIIELGGSFPSNQSGFGFVGIAHQRFKRIPSKLHGRLHFGSFYSAGELSSRFDFYQSFPFALEFFLMEHRFQYTRSVPTFFQELRPAFLIAEEREAGVRLSVPTGIDGVLGIDFLQMHTEDRSYREWLFNPVDTSDSEAFRGRVTEIHWAMDSRSEPQLSRKGRYISVRAQRFVGATQAEYQDSDTWIQSQRNLAFLRFRLEASEMIPLWNNRLAMGYHAALNLSDEPLRSTYRSSLAQSMAYSPMLGSKARFLEAFRALNFAAAGGVLDIQVLQNAFLRAEVHAFHALPGIYQAEKGPAFRDRTPTRIMAGIRVHSNFPIGPISLGLEYYESEREPWFVELHWGYRIFNRSSRR